MSKVKMLKVIDKTDSYYTKIPKFFDLPMKILINGKSQLSGKSTTILNLLLNEDFPYHKLFEGDDIYIVSNNKLDNKVKILVDVKEIPLTNIMSYNEAELEALYEELEDKFMEETMDGGKPNNRIIIFDDVGYSGNLKNKQFGIVTKMIANGRHLNLSQIYTSQRFSMVNTTLRTNITGAILYSTSLKELELIADDMNYLDSKRKFIKLFREATKEKHSFLVVRFSGDPNELYLNSNFEPIQIK